MPPHKVAGKLAKKAAKKVAKKAAKKAAKKGARPQGHDLRRAYEHLHRVNILHDRLSEQSLAQIDTLTRLAQNALGVGDDRSAADLLRAAEHLTFGSLATSAGDPSVSASLTSAAHAEYDHLLERAAAHWEERSGASPRGVASVYRSMLAEARSAMNAGALHRGLEFARGAEALTHVEARPPQVDAGPARKAIARS